MNSFILDHAVDYIKTIADTCRCVSCDELKNLRVRYSCGHSVCENCVSTAEDCLLCSPPDVSTHVNDGPLNLRVEHALDLLDSFQKLFKLDVYRRQRVSERLQVEKQLFPKCIQALSKYSNSKRLSNISIQNKENVRRTLFPGENTSKTFSKMENKMSYVQQWLNNNETSLIESNYNLPRKPFTDINVNRQNVTRPKIANKVTKQKKTLSRKKNYLKSFKSDGKDKSKLSLTSIRKDVEMKNGKQQQMKCDQNESGIVIEDDIVIINETPSPDKDKEAWLAVIEADKNCPRDDKTVSKFSKSEIEDVVITNPIDKPIQCQNMEAMAKVPFYKKSSFLKYANNQINEINNKEIFKSTSKTDNVTIKVENSGFVTTIQFYKDVQTNDGTKYSVGVQTENQNDNQESDTSMKANQHHSLQPIKKPKGLLIIDDSDSDSEILPTVKDSLLEVTAEVHRSETENDCSILSPLEQREYEHRLRHAVRGHTPASTDSSDKENFDPNRAKRQKLDKKHCSKK